MRLVGITDAMAVYVNFDRQVALYSRIQPLTYSESKPISFRVFVEVKCTSIDNRIVCAS